MGNIMHLRTPKRGTLLNVLGILLVVTFVLPFVVFALPGVVGAEGGYVVISSSMSPTIKAGDVVLVNEISAASVNEGDIITFGDGERDATRNKPGTDLVTHRVVDVVKTDDGLAFKTKGDANEEADQQLVPADALAGRVMFSVPYIGHVIAFAGTRLGFIALVAIPIGLLILGEIYDLARAARRQRESTEPNQQEGD
jgi:signal peptidase